MESISHSGVPYPFLGNVISVINTASTTQGGQLNFPVNTLGNLLGSGEGWIFPIYMVTELQQTGMHITT